jgi:hypothetical protein
MCQHNRPLKARTPSSCPAPTHPHTHTHAHPQLKLLPEELNQILIIIVVLSMVITPALAEFGTRLADYADARSEDTSDDDDARPALPAVSVSGARRTCWVAAQAQCWAAPSSSQRRH